MLNPLNTIKARVRSIFAGFHKTLRWLTFPAKFRAFKSLSRNVEQRFSLKWADRYVCLDDGTNSVPYSHIYLYHLSWAARVITKTMPARHIDISSHVYFVGLMSSIVPVDYYEFRTPQILLDNLNCDAVDLTALPFADNSIKSLSCMHVIEHIGLGRYGEKLDPEGDLKAMKELQRVLAVGGDLLFVVPIGQPRIEFNAHRIYSYAQIIDSFQGLHLKQFALIQTAFEGAQLIYGASQSQADEQINGCGCFWFKKNSE